MNSRNETVLEQDVSDAEYKAVLQTVNAKQRKYVSRGLAAQSSNHPWVS